MRLLLLGATGAVGSAVLPLALGHARVDAVIAPTRRPLTVTHPKLVNPRFDAGHWQTHPPGWHPDAVICALGTTLREAGSRTAFVQVDRDLPVALGQLALQEGARTFVLNSSLGARAGRNFYLHTKWEAEQAISALGFNRLVLVRPSLIDTRRTRPRPAETLGIWLCRLLNPVLPRQYRSVKPAQIAQALLQGALATEPGVQVIESDAVQKFARS